MFLFQKQQNSIKIPSGVHGGFKITKPNKFSNVQKYLKLWLTTVAINFRIYPIIFMLKKLFVIFIFG